MRYRIFADPDPSAASLAGEIMKRLGQPVSYGPPPPPENYAEAKRTIHIRKNKGEFLKPCPCTPGHTGCGYRFLNIATNCPMDCSYCILQEYLGPGPIILHCNIDDMLDELDRDLSDSSAFRRIGTGELTDSLAVDNFTGYSRTLVPFFASKQNAVLELKTKTSSVGNLAGLEHGGRTVVAWSLNPPDTAASEESGSASVEDRLAAAVKCQDEGYRLAFHLDPLISFPGWRRAYADLVEMLVESGVQRRSVVWISLGTVRFVPRMREIIAERFPGSSVRHGEFVRGSDGKLRYFKPVRIEMYREVASAIGAVWPDVLVYLCMETPEVWQASLGWSPGTCELSSCLNERADLG